MMKVMTWDKALVVCGCFAAAMCLASQASATLVTISDQPDVVDADIRAGSANTSFDRSVLPITNRGGTSAHTKGYIRFALPDDIDTVDSATLTLTFAVSRSSGKTYNVYALNDGVTDESDWIEADGPSAGMTWNNAPANVTTNGTDFTSDATFLGEIVKAASAPSMTFSLSTLVDALNADNNDFLTVMLSVDNITSSSDQIASAEHASIIGPQLTLDYTPVAVPEPSSAILQVLLSIGLLAKRRRR